MKNIFVHPWWAGHISHWTYIDINREGSLGRNRYRIGRSESTRNEEEICASCVTDIDSMHWGYIKERARYSLDLYTGMGYNQFIETLLVLSIYKVWNILENLFVIPGVSLECKWNVEGMRERTKWQEKEAMRLTRNQR